VRKFRIDNQTVGEMIGEVDLEGWPVDWVAEDWLWKKGAWQPWTECSTH